MTNSFEIAIQINKSFLVPLKETLKDKPQTQIDYFPGRKCSKDMVYWQFRFNCLIAFCQVFYLCLRFRNLVTKAFLNLLHRRRKNYFDKKVFFSFFVTLFVWTSTKILIEWLKMSFYEIKCCCCWKEIIDRFSGDLLRTWIAK